MNAPGLGRFHLYRNRGQGYVELIRNVITPSSVAGGFLKYAGLAGETAVLVALGIGAVLIILQVTLGWLDVRYRVAEAHQAAENAVDPWRRDVVRLLEEIAKQRAETRTVAGSWTRVECTECGGPAVVAFPRSLCQTHQFIDNVRVTR